MYPRKCLERKCSHIPRHIRVGFFNITCLGGIPGGCHPVYREDTSRTVRWTTGTVVRRSVPRPFIAPEGPPGRSEPGDRAPGDRAFAVWTIGA